MTEKGTVVIPRIGEEVDIVDVTPAPEIESDSSVPVAEKFPRPLVALRLVAGQLVPEFLVAVMFAVISLAFIVWSAWLGEYSTIGAGARAQRQTSSDSGSSPESLEKWAHPVHVVHQVFIQFWLQSCSMSIACFMFGVKRSRWVLTFNGIAAVLIFGWIVLSRGFLGISETIYIIPNYVVFITFVIVDGLLLAGKPRGRFLMLFSVPLVGSAVLLAIYDFSILPWFARADDNSRLLIRLFVQPFFYSLLLFFGRFCGQRSAEAAKFDAIGGEEQQRGVCFSTAPLFLYVYFAVFLSSNLSILGTFVSVIVTDVVNFCVRMFLWNKYRLRGLLLKCFTPQFRKYVETRHAWLFHDFRGDHFYGHYLVTERIMEIASIFLAWLCYIFYVVGVTGEKPDIGSSLARLFIQVGTEIVFHTAFCFLELVHGIPFKAHLLKVNLGFLSWIWFVGTTFVVYRSWLVLEKRWWSI